MHTVAPSEMAQQRRKKQRKRPTTGGFAAGRAAAPPPNRARRRAMLLEAAAEVTYVQLLQQHQAWLDYAAPAVRGVAADGLPALLAKLDWHGARVRVTRSKSTAYADAHGLVLTETRRMLLLLNETRRAWIPKTGTAVEVTLPDGKVAQCEAAERDYPPPPP